MLLRKMLRSLRVWRCVWCLGSALCLAAVLAPTTSAQSAGVSANVRAGGIDSHQRKQTGSRIRRSRALGLVAAPIDKVLAVVSDYGSYHQFMPNFVASRVLSQRGGQALMYMEVSALDGMATLWMQMQLHMLESTAPTRVIKASMLKGNLKDFAAEWQVTAFGAKHTLVAFELCADPDFHIPFADSLVSDYNEKEARKSILALRRQLSRRPSEQ